MSSTSDAWLAAASENDGLSRAAATAAFSSVLTTHRNTSYRLLCQFFSIRIYFVYCTLLGFFYILRHATRMTDCWYSATVITTKPHCWHMSTNKIWRRTESTPWSIWWHSHMAVIYSDCSTREIIAHTHTHTHTHTYTQPFKGPLSRTTQVSLC